VTGLLCLLGFYGLIYFWITLKNEENQSRWRKEQYEKNLKAIIENGFH